MTKHWDRIDCQGCTYLRAHGLPDSFIQEDHAKEIGEVMVECVSCKHPAGDCEGDYLHRDDAMEYVADNYEPPDGC